MTLDFFRPLTEVWKGFKKKPDLFVHFSLNNAFNIISLSRFCLCKGFASVCTLQYNMKRKFTSCWVKTGALPQTGSLHLIKENFHLFALLLHSSERLQSNSPPIFCLRALHCNPSMSILGHSFRYTVIPACLVLSIHFSIVLAVSHQRILSSFSLVPDAAL